MVGIERSNFSRQLAPLVHEDWTDKKILLTKTSGKKKQYKGGYQRDDDSEKLRYDLIPLELLTRLAGLYTRGAKLYGDSNWKLANDEKGYQRFRQSAWRHFIQWNNGEEDEDHAIACVFNIFGYEYHNKHKNKK